MKKLLWVVWVFGLSTSGWAGQVVENFSTLTYRDASSTGIWNSSLGYAHPPLAVDTTVGNAVDNENGPVTDVGDGSDGPFDVSTYAQFSVGGVTTGNVITIDTNAHPVLQLTYFYLASGWTIRGTGSNPLWFKVLGNFTNDGTIDCSGDSGSASGAVGTSPSGGTGRCGGGTGGSGSACTGTGGTGTSGCTVPACTVAGGAGGADQANNAGGGGGGGGYNSNVAAPSGGAASPPGGVGGASQSDPNFAKFGTASGGPGGGSGGGGGGCSTTTNPGSGAGGGGGGGVIRIVTAGAYVSNGSVLAKGGNGGAESSGSSSGAGGGGAGGSIWIQAAGDLTTNGPTDATFGNGGTLSGLGTGTGGNGANGRTWLVQGGNIGGTTGETPPINPGPVGEIRFSELSYVLVSKAYDSGNTKPTYTSFSLSASLPGTSTATLLVAGSSDGFASDDTGFVPAASVSVLQGKRYFRFKITFQYTPAAPFDQPIPTPLQILSVTANFDGVKQTVFPFTPACGNLGDPWEFLFILLVCYLVAQITTGRLGIRFLKHRTTNSHPC